MTWLSDANGGLKTRISSDRGTTWGGTEPVTFESDGAFQTAVLGSRVGVVWTTADGVITRQFTYTVTGSSVSDMLGGLNAAAGGTVNTQGVNTIVSDSSALKMPAPSAPDKAMASSTEGNAYRTSTVRMIALLIQPPA